MLWSHLVVAAILLASVVSKPNPCPGPACPWPGPFIIKPRSGPILWSQDRVGLSANKSLQPTRYARG